MLLTEPKISEIQPSDEVEEQKKVGTELHSNTHSYSQLK
jgi:hypothetical protein